MIIGMEKSGIILDNCNTDLEKAITLLITDEFVTVNFPPVYDTKHVKFKSSKTWDQFGSENRWIHCIANFSILKPIL